MPSATIACTSPDGRLVLRFELDAGRPVYAVTRDGNPWLDQSALTDYSSVAQAGDGRGTLRGGIRCWK